MNDITAFGSSTSITSFRFKRHFKIQIVIKTALYILPFYMHNFLHVYKNFSTNNSLQE